MPVSADDTVPEQRILEQAARLPPEGAVTGWAACLLHGAALLDGLQPDGRTRMPVPLAVGQRSRMRAGPDMTLSHDRLSDEERTRRHGVPCVTVLRAVFDAMRFADGLREAVVVLDMAAAAELTTIRRMRAYCLGRAGWTGVGLVRAALDLASEHSWSPNETRLRLVWVLDAGLPVPRCNQPVYDRRGALQGIADLLEVTAGVAGEYDGADHRAARRHTRDVAKDESFRAHGIEVFRVTGLDLPRRDLVVRRMCAAHARGSRLPADQRAWTLRAPYDEPPPTLDDVLDQREWMARVHAEQERELRARPGLS